MLPADDHAHTQWSWDATAGSMERSCARAVQLGLPSIAFTEHADFTTWVLPEQATAPAEDDPVFAAPPLDTEGYLACLDECRERFPGLRIVSGIEAGEPHLFPDQVATLIGDLRADRVLGSLHSLYRPGGYRFVEHLFTSNTVVADLMRDYLAETLRMVESCDIFGVLAHIDYPVRAWPATAGDFRPEAFEEEYRAVLRALAASGRALEVNTTVPLSAAVVRWWYETGGDAVTFGSDAHEPPDVARGFTEAAAIAEAAGFHPGHHPHDFWQRHR